MNTKKKLSLTAIFLVVGLLFIFLGLSYGTEIALTLSRPIGANSWSTSGELMFGCTLTPVILGAYFLILSLKCAFVLLNDFLTK